MGRHKQGKRVAQVRVIAGRWRGRKIRFDGEGVRPTGDRVRETAFNWLMPSLPGARCLDLFAGSGALGIEAASRGAAAVLFVERDRVAAEQIAATLAEFGAESCVVLNQVAERVELQNKGPFDIVFLDPPFDGPDMANLCKLVEASGALTGDCLVYLEMRRTERMPELPGNWNLIRQQHAGQVSFGLAQRAGGNGAE